jgi:hypothetical protein
MTTSLPATKTIDERFQKLVDKALYAGGRPSAQKIRDFLNGTWLGEPLHVVLTEIPIGAWTAAICFDAIDSTRSTRGFALAADASITIGLLAAAAAATTGLADRHFLSTTKEEDPRERSPRRCSRLRAHCVLGPPGRKNGLRQ